MQIKDIQSRYIDEIFKKVGRINSLTVGGGEPSLNVSALEYICYFAKKRKVEIDNFYVVTNGKVVSDNFIKAIFDLYLMCKDNEYSGLALSVDKYHEKVPADNIRKLKVFGFFQEKTNGNLILEGRAKKLPEDLLRSRDEKVYKIDVEDGYVQGMLYLNCEGNIINGCDWSYKSQDKKENIVCGLEQLSLEAITLYNYKHFS
jgi:organic radical activating enzyme